jgi:GDSL-like Lipase/Acylhydrolase family
VKRRIRALAINAALVVGSIALCLLVFELFVFRFVLVASDVPANDFVNDLVRYAPNQTGVWRLRNEIAAPYAINAQGWNSGNGDYVVARRPGLRRIAIVGDSYVEALQVPFNRSFGEGVAAELSRGAAPVEDYRFAISGAPLSQYLHMVEREVTRYAPDWIVVLLIHNDFLESLNPLAGRYTSSFLKVRVTGGRVEEIAPQPWRPGPADWVRRTATMRYLYYRLHFPIEEWRDWLIPQARAGGGRFSANVDIDAVLRQMPDIVAATDHLFGRLAAVARADGAHLLFAMDGDRQSIYAGSRELKALALNTMAAELAAKHGIAFLDLHPVFDADWRANGKHFEHPSDNHWNERAHALAAHAIAAAIKAREK